jgi:hypothetical protein
MTVSNGKNVKDWTIRSHVPKAVSLAKERVQRLDDSGSERLATSMKA